MPDGMEKEVCFLRFLKNAVQGLRNTVTPIKRVYYVSHAARGTRWDRGHGF